MTNKHLLRLATNAVAATVKHGFMSFEVRPSTDEESVILTAKALDPVDNTCV